MNEQERIEVEHVAQDRWRIRFRGHLLHVDAQALIDLADWIEVNRTSILMALDRAQSEGSQEAIEDTLRTIEAATQPVWRTGDIYIVEVRTGVFTIHRYDGESWDQLGAGHTEQDIQTLVASMEFLGEGKGKRRYYRPTE